MNDKVDSTPGAQGPISAQLRPIDKAFAAEPASARGERNADRASRSGEPINPTASAASASGWEAVAGQQLASAADAAGGAPPGKLPGG
jgi:hypothetical protein